MRKTRGRPTDSSRIAVLVRTLLADLAGLREAGAVARRAAASSASTLLVGGDEYEREALACEIHARSAARGRFMRVCCAGAEPAALSLMLLGTRVESRCEEGYLAKADGGLLFVDGIEHLPSNLQYRLRTFIESGAYHPVASSDPSESSARIVFGSTTNVENLVVDGTLRAAFVARAAVIRIQLPGLAERTEDLSLVAKSLLNCHSETLTFSDDALASICAHHWRGGLAELDSELERLVFELDGVTRPVEVRDLRSEVRERRYSPETNVAGRAIGELMSADATLREVVEAVERLVLSEGLARCRGNRSQLAKNLGISRSNVIQKIKKYGLA